LCDIYTGFELYGKKNAIFAKITKITVASQKVFRQIASKRKKFGLATFRENNELTDCSNFLAKLSVVLCREGFLFLPCNN
jgi:hypothetical protein